jgi:hypothetical protein
MSSPSAPKPLGGYLPLTILGGAAPGSLGDRY